MNALTDTQAGVVTIVGKPNVGKSTLLNGMLGLQVAPVSSKPQTTRRQLRGISTEGNRQVVFVDTPGLHAEADQLDNYMQRQIREALEEVDVVLWVVDLRHPPTREDEMVAEQLKPMLAGTPVWLVGNKLDAASQPDNAMTAYQALLPDTSRAFRLSALDAAATDGLRTALLEAMPPGPMLYPPDHGKSDQTPERWASEMIRQAAMERLRQEIPYAVAVKVDTFEEREKRAPSPPPARKTAKPGRVLYCHATLFVEREAHKPIVIGHHGQMLKTIGQRARKSLETLLGLQVYLDLEVKVYPNWRKDREALRELEFQ